MQQDKTEAWGSVGPSADVSALSRTEGERRSDTGIMDQEDNEIVHQSDYGDPGALGSQVVDPLFARLAWDPGEDQQSDAAFPADQGPSALGLFTSRAKVGIDHDKKESTPVLRSQRTRKKWKSALLKVNSTFAIQHSQHEENAARREILKAMNKDVLGNWREEENSTSKLIKMVLGSDKSTEEMVDFIYDRRKLETEIKHLMRVEREERERQRRAEEMRRDHKHKKEEKNQLLLTDPDPPGKHTKSSADLFANNDSPEVYAELLGLKKNRQQFLAMVKSLEKQDANQLIVARLMQEVADFAQKSEKGLTGLEFLNFYTCMHPESAFLWLWTTVYVLSILYIATWGLLSTTFMSPEGACVRDVTDWIDIGIDAFFVADILGRLFFFGQIIEQTAIFSTQKAQILLVPDQVLVRYVRTGLVVDLITGIPFSWIIMFGLPCDPESSDLSSLRLIRIIRGTRVTRVLKLFQQPHVRRAVRRFKRALGNGNVIQLFFLMFQTLLFNHIWTCLGWLVQSVDLDDVDQDGRNGFQEYLESINLLPESSMFLKYSKMFMVTLQTLFAIDPFQGDTLAEIWFGVLTLFISVCLHATFVSFIIEIMESMNKAQSSLEQRINSVTSFLRMNGIDGDLRNDVLDYFEFRFANSNDQDNDNRILDSLPTELQSRIIKRIFPRAIESAYIFSACNESFVSKLVIKMSRNQQRTMPNQIITAQGSLEEQMYLLKSGSAEVKVTDERGFAVSLMNIHSGQVFGELSLWMECRRTATVKSTKFCQVFILTRVDLVDVLKSYPGMEVVIATHALAAALRVEELCPGLSGISTNTSERLGKRMADQCREFEDGEVLISEGQPADEAWIVRTGKVTTEVCGGKLALFQEQRCVGFTSLFCERPHQECVRAKGPTLAYRLTRHDVDEIFVDDPLTLKALRRSCTRNYKATGQRNTFLRWHFVSNCLTSLSSNQAIRKSSSFTGFADGLRRTLDTGGLGAIANQVAREEDGDGKGASMDSVKQVSRQHIKLAPLPLEKKGMQ